MEVMLENLAQIMPPLCRVAREAGKILMEYYGQVKCGALAIDRKADGSIVTRADTDSESYILSELARTFPDIPVVAEEAVSQGHIPDISAGTFFTVDPLDGTKEFIGQTGGFVVAIGVVINSRAVAGVIYHPAFDELYYGFGPKTSVRIDKNSQSHKISVRQPVHPPRVLLNGKHGDHSAVYDLYARIFKDSMAGAFRDNTQDVCTLDPQSGIFRFCQIAEGTADLFAFVLKEKTYSCGGYWWDTVPGQAIVESAGGHVVDFTGKRVFYNTQNPASFLSPAYVVAGSGMLLENIRQKHRAFAALKPASA